MLYQSPQLDRVFHALSDPTRRAVLDRLTASGLISTEKLGRTRTCCVSAEAIARAEQWLSARRELWEARLDRMEAYVLRLQTTEKKRGKRAHRK